MEENMLNITDTNEIIDESIKNDAIYLPTGQALLPAETYTITSSEKSRFIVLLGGVASGKTAICISAMCKVLQIPRSTYYGGTAIPTLCTTAPTRRSLSCLYRQAHHFANPS